MWSRGDRRKERKGKEKKIETGGKKNKGRKKKKKREGENIKKQASAGRVIVPGMETGVISSI